MAWRFGRALLGLMLCVACSGAGWGRVAQGLAAAPRAGPKLMIFGGLGHQTYLGCLSCSEYDRESVFNSYGSFGSPYSSTSVLNPYSQFGSRYSAYGACNPYASDPPVIVDADGNYYGRLTTNRARSDGPPTPEVAAWLAGVCSE